MAQFNPTTGQWDADPAPVSSTAKNPWDEPWGDPNVANLGNINLLGNGRAFGGAWQGGQALKPGGSATNYSLNEKGLNQYGVDSLETAQNLAKKYGGTVGKGYQGGGNPVSNDASNPDGAIPGAPDQGWGYYWTPPGETLKDQKKITDQIGMTEKQTGLNGLSDGQFLALAASLVGGAAFLGPELAAGEIAPEGFEAASLAGPSVGTGTELTAEEMAAASASPAVQASVAQTAGMTPTEFSEFLNSTAAPTYPGSGAPPTEGAPPTDPSTPPTDPATTPKPSSLPQQLGTKALSTLASQLMKPNAGSTANSGATGMSGMGGYGSIGTPTNFAQNSGQAAAQQNPQTQQLAALLLGNPDQPKFGNLSYQADDNSMLAKLAAQLQNKDDSYYG